MKPTKLLLAVATCAGLFAVTGCMSSSWTRLIPENKSSDIYVRSIYGTIEVHTRVDGTNAIGPLVIDSGSSPITVPATRLR